MKTQIKTLMLILAALALSSCGMFGGGKYDDYKAEKELPKYENYSSSGIYADIEGEAGDAVSKNSVRDLAAAQGRQLDTEDYSDDEYGELDADKDELYMGGVDEDEENNEEPASMNEPGTLDTPIGAVNEAGTEVEPEAPVATSLPKFKNGMHRTSKKCTMRREPSASSTSEGTVKKGKKLWMEGVKGHTNWVKIYKKSGAVYLPRACL